MINLSGRMPLSRMAEILDRSVWFIKQLMQGKYPKRLKGESERAANRVLAFRSGSTELHAGTDGGPRRIVTG